MTTTTNNIQKNLKIHNAIIRAGYCPIPGLDTVISKEQQPWARVSGEFKERWDKHIADGKTGKMKNPDKPNDPGGEFWDMDGARIVGNMNPSSDAIHEIYGGEGKGVNILLDGKLALLDFDDKELPDLWKDFEEEFPFLQDCYKDVNPMKPWSVHYLIPDDEEFIGHTGTGQITSKGLAPCHLLHPKVDGASVKVDFKKVAKNGRWSKHIDERTATTYGGQKSPTISTYSQREMKYKLPRFSKLLKIKDRKSYEKFKLYMKRVYQTREQPNQEEHTEIETAPTKSEQIKIKTKTTKRIKSPEDFKKLPVWKFIEEEYPTDEGFIHTISCQKDGRFFIDLGKSEASRTCPFNGNIHRKNNQWLLYLPLQQKLIQYCFGCSGENTEVDWKESSNYEQAFWEACGTGVKDSLDDAEECMEKGKHAVGSLLNEHLCYIDKKGKSEYVIYNYGYQYSVKERPGIVQYFEKDKFKPKLRYKVKNADGSETHKVFTDTGTGGVGGKINPGECWLQYPKQFRRCYQGFRPNENYDDRGRMFNTFQGFAITLGVCEAYMEHRGIKPHDIEGLMKPVLDHILTIWCNNKQNRFDYVLNWFSQCLQTPCRKTRVALCLKSDFEGAGKSVIVGMMKKIIGDYHAVSLNEFPEGFNDIMADKCFINLDEATWGKDKSAAKVKVFITEHQQQIKKKFKDEYTQECYHNTIISTNEGFMCPKDIGSRRYYILDLSNKFAGILTKEKKEHFKPIWEIAEQPELFAYYLYTRDISEYEAADFEETEIGIAVAEQGMSNTKAWYYRCLVNDEFYAEEQKQYVEGQGMVKTDDIIYRCGDLMPKVYLEKSYCNYTGSEWGSSKRWTQMWRDLYKMIPRKKIDAGQRLQFQRRHCVIFPDLETTRSFFLDGWGGEPGAGMGLSFEKDLGYDEEDGGEEVGEQFDISPNKPSNEKVDLDDDDTPQVKPSKVKKIIKKKIIKKYGVRVIKWSSQNWQHEEDTIEIEKWKELETKKWRCAITVDKKVMDVDEFVSWYSESAKQSITHTIGKFGLEKFCEKTDDLDEGITLEFD
jgi:hypothetical protein